MIELANDRWFPLVNLGSTTFAAMLWYLSSGRIGWPLLVFVLVPWFLRLAVRRSPFRRTRFDGWLIIFGLTAVFSIFTAYNRELAQGKFWVLFGALAVYLAIVSISRRDVFYIAGATGPIGVLLSFYFVMSNDWHLWPADIALLNRIGELWMRIRPSLIHLPVVHPNTIGGMIALMFPFTVAFGVYGWQTKKIPWVQQALFSGVIMLGGLFFTSSLGAWLALAVGLAGWALWWLCGVLSKKRFYRQRVLFIVLALLGLVLVSPLTQTNMVQTDGAARLDLAKQTFYLIQDFALTGSGLSSFPALYAQYVRVTPTFFATYSNLYFDVWLEQGFFAFLALLIMLAVSFWLLVSRVWAKNDALPLVPTHGQQTSDMRQRERQRRKLVWLQQIGLYQWAALVSLVVMCLHGAIDDALYGTQATPLLFFAPAMAILVTRRRDFTAVAPVSFGWQRWVLSVGAIAVLLTAVYFSFQETVLSHWYANQGALAMAKAELVHWPTNRWHTGDHLEAFAAAVGYFEQSLAIDENNRTANHRLGLIAMVARDYETAVTHLEAAVSVTESHRGIAKSLGYSYAWLGDYDQAVHYLGQIPEAKAEMAIYTNWWKHQDRPDFAARAREMVSRLENITLWQ